MKLKFLYFAHLTDAGFFHKASAIPEKFYQPYDAVNSRENYFGVRYTECQDQEFSGIDIEIQFSDDVVFSKVFFNFD